MRWPALAPQYAAEALGSVAGTLLSIGVSFFMKSRFGWEMPQIFLLTAGLGLVYVPGALSAGWFARCFGRRRVLCATYAALALLSLGAWKTESASGIAVFLLAYTLVIGVSWPVLEGLIASGESSGLAKRLALYNVIWPAAGALAIAVEGTVIRFWIDGIFLLPAAMHLASLALMAVSRDPTHVQTDVAMPVAPLHAEPELRKKRELALWLSRTALPATYTVIYGLMPIMPFLPVMKGLNTSGQTLAASVWLMARGAAFLILGAGTWWHTRPRLLLWAAILMLISFFGMTLRPTNGASFPIDLLSMILWQIVFGLALGMIYSASLYFGMVLSDGSTEHGGYHEALIGLGWVLGPAAGVAAERLRPGELWAGIAAVGAVIAASVVVVVIIAAVMGGRGKRPAEV